MNTGDRRREKEKLERLRDEFAVAALKGLLADPHRELTCKDLAEISYEVADEMLKERLK